MRKTCLNAIYELAKQDERIVFIGSDLGAGVLEDFKRKMPDRFFMEGVGEANMIGMAAGMALSGKIVYVNTIATFLTRRAYEQVCLDVGLHHANVRLIGNGGGAVYAPLGPTHIATDDIALMRLIPGMTILSPCDAVEMAELMPKTVNHQGPIYLRLGKGGDPLIAKPRLREYGNNTLIISTGTTSQLAKEAARKLNVSYCHVSCLKPLELPDWFTRFEHVITVEDHSIVGGLGNAVESALCYPVRKIGYPDVFPSGYGTQDEMRARYGISVDNIITIVKELRGSTR